MAYSYSSQIADGVTRVFSFSFVGSGYGYIRDSDIKVYVDGVQQSGISMPAPNQIQFVTPPAAGKTVLIRRVMPKDAPYSAWNRGNNLTQEMLNNTILQQLYVMHEIFDGFAFDNLQVTNDINMRNNRIINMKDAVNPQDAVTLNQLTSYEASIGAASQTAAASAAAAVAAQVAANSYKDTAVTKANEASASATQAAASAAAAASSASTASTKASESAASATAAAASALTAKDKADYALQYSNASYDAMLLSAGYKDTAGISATTANNDANRAEVAAARAEAATPAAGLLAANANLGDLGNREYALDNLGIGTQAAASSDDNLLINPSGTIFQYGPATTNGGWVCDMWSMGGCGGLVDSVFTANRVFDLTQYTRGAHSYLSLTYSNAATLSSTHAPNLSLVVPRFFSTPLFGNTFTVSFWVTSTKAGTYSVTVRSRNSRICYVHPYTIASANTWTKVSFTVQGGLPTTSASDVLYWGDGNTASYRLTFCTGFVGSDYITTTPDTWVDAGSTTALGVAAQSNNQAMLVAGDMMKVTAVKVELGKRATPFRMRNPMIDTAMCQQYYEEVVLSEVGMTSTALSGTNPWYKAFTYRLKAAVPTITTKGSPSLTNITAVAYNNINSGNASMLYTWTAGPNLYAYYITAIVDARGQLS